MHHQHAPLEQQSWATRCHLVSLSGLPSFRWGRLLAIRPYDSDFPGRQKRNEQGQYLRTSWRNHIGSNAIGCEACGELLHHMHYGSLGAPVGISRKRRSIVGTDTAGSNDLASLLETSPLVAFVQQLEECSHCVEDACGIYLVRVSEICRVPVPQVVAKIRDAGIRAEAVQRWTCNTRVCNYHVDVAMLRFEF